MGQEHADRMNLFPPPLAQMLRCSGFNCRPSTLHKRPQERWPTRGCFKLLPSTFKRQRISSSLRPQELRPRLGRVAVSSSRLRGFVTSSCQSHCWSTKHVVKSTEIGQSWVGSSTWCRQGCLGVPLQPVPGLSTSCTSLG